MRTSSKGKLFNRQTLSPLTRTVDILIGQQNESTEGFPSGEKRMNEMEGEVDKQRA